MKNWNNGTNDDMISVGRAVVEAITELRIATGGNNGRIISFRPLTGGDELLFTATSSTIIRTMYVTNVSGTSTNARIYHVAKGSTPGQSNALYFDFPIATGAVLFVQPAIQLAVGEAIWVRSSTGGNLAFNFYGA
jgi:hypothetical protein